MSMASKLIEKISDLANSVGGAFDKNFTSAEERMEKKAELLKIVNDLMIATLSAQKELIAIELKGNWLQKSWRPIVMLSFNFIIIYAYFVQPAFFPEAVNVQTTLNDNFWELLKIGFGGYVVGRSAEQITKSVAGAISSKKGRN